MKPSKHMLCQKAYVQYTNLVQIMIPYDQNKLKSATAVTWIFCLIGFILVWFCKLITFETKTLTAWD